MRLHWSVIFLCLAVFVCSKSSAQSIQLDLNTDREVLVFLDEMNTLHHFHESFVTLQLTRSDVFDLLRSIDAEKLNQRQLNQLKFFEQEFSKDSRLPAERPESDQLIHSPFRFLNRYKQPDLLYYQSEKATVTVNPIVGLNVMSNKNGTAIQRRIGAEFQGYIGRIGLYGSVKDVYESDPLSGDSILGPREGALYKFNADGTAEYSETRGGITYGWNGGYIGLVRDHVRWGYGYNGTNIFDNNAPPFTQLKLHLNPVEWFQFDYFHGSLQSDVVDSSTISTVSGVTTFDYHNKYIAANMLSLRPWKRLWVSVGNSIIYSSRTPEPTFFIPLMFYKSADHYLNARNNRAGGNAQMFAALSIRPVKKLHLYTTLFVDEISFRRMFDSERHSNWFSLKSGLRVVNLLPNVSTTLEYVRTNPMVYKHFLETTDFTNAGYNLGHSLRDNSQEFNASLEYRPLYWLSLKAQFAYAEKGIDFADDRETKDPNTGILLVLGRPFIETTLWQQTVYSFLATAQPIYNLQIQLGVKSIVRKVDSEAYTPDYLQGNSLLFHSGINYRF